MNNQLRKLEEDQNYQLRHWVLLALGDLLILSLLASSGALDVAMQFMKCTELKNGVLLRKGSL